MNTLTINNNFRLVSGKIDGIELDQYLANDTGNDYARVTIEGRTYTKINELRLIDSEGTLHSFHMSSREGYRIDRLGLDFVVAWLNLEEFFENKEEVLNKIDWLIKNIQRDGEEKLDEILCENYCKNLDARDTRYLQGESRICEYTGERTYLYKRGSFYDECGDNHSIIDLRIYNAGLFTYCDECGSYFWHEDCLTDTPDGLACEDCYSDNFSDCEHCGETDRTDYFHEDSNGYWSCESCYEETSSGIHEYRYTPELREWYINHKKELSSKVLTDEKELFGMEIETAFSEGLSERDKSIIVDSIHRQGNGELFYCKHDSSIDDENGNGGAEIVSHPMTYNAFKNLPLNDMILKHRGDILGYDANNCGMHVHVNRASLSPLNQYKLVTFINHFSSFSYAVSQRKLNKINAWSRFQSNIGDLLKQELVKSYAWDKTRDNKTDYKKYKRITCGYKSRATNLLHSKTIEIRIFRATLKEESLRKNVEFVKAVVDWCKSSTTKDYLDFSSFWSFVLKGDYKNLISWVEKQDWSESLLRFPLTRTDGLEK